jgi:capsid protein
MAFSVADMFADSIPVQASYVGQGVAQDWTGEKYPGGFGATALYNVDYWTLRQRSSQLFRDNLYARGIVRRLVTNIINTGLNLECKPDEQVLGVEKDSLSEWAENQENRFNIWGSNPQVCDFYGERTFGALQRQAQEEALISGDILVTLYLSPKTKLPQIRLISGNSVRTPFDKTPRKGHTIEHGVELDAQERQVAYWVAQKDGTHKRVPAFGEKSGRRIAWLFYGTPRRIDEVRGEPLLSIVLQATKEIDRYRDATLRKAGLNASIVAFIEKTEDKPSTKPLTNAGLRRDSVVTQDDSSGTRTYNSEGFVPGLVFETLQTGEKPVPYSTAGTDVNFGKFEEAVVQSMAWVYEIPPSILTLSFSSNYSASGGEINEFKMFLNPARVHVGTGVGQPIYIEWFVSEALLMNVEAPGFLESWRDPSQYDTFGAWVAADWSGAIKPSLDQLKTANAYKKMVNEGWLTNARAARELTGTKFSKNIDQLRRENEQKAEAARPLLALEQEFGTQETATALALVDEAVQGLQDATDDIRGVV